MTEKEWLLYQEQIVSRILAAPIHEAIKIYEAYFHVLQGFSFLLPHPQGINFVNIFQELNLDKMDVVSFFGDSLCGLNAHSFMSEKFQQDYDPRFVLLASLDTQIQSYLYRNYIGETSRVPTNIAEIKKIIDSRMCMVDGFAYMFENALFIPNSLKTQIYTDNTFAFETYFFKDENKAKDYSKQILDFDKQLLNDNYSNCYRHQYLLYYLELLVMVDIYLNHKNLTSFQKELMFVKYFHEQINIMSDREINLAILFFKHGTQIKFFGKIQRGRDDIIENLRNMAWDIFHLNNTFNNIPRIPNEADFIIPFFITYDRRLKEIAPIYKLRSAAFIKNTQIKQLNFLTDLMNPSIKQEYFSVKAYSDRQKVLKGVTEKSIISKLQFEIQKYEKTLG